MSPGPRHRVVSLWRRQGASGRWWSVALAAGALAAVLAAPAGAAVAPHERVTGSVRAWHPSPRDTPTEVIDAKTDPQAAGDALNTGCVDLSNCQWKATSPITVGYGPPKIIGDALYNCTDPQTEPDAYSETAVGISTEREESTSISESLSLEVGTGFLDVEKVSAEFEVFSKQSESFSTEVTTQSAVSVPPGWEGWNEYKVLTASVTGDAYITNGIHLTKVTGIDLDFPGYTDPNTTNDSPVKFILQRSPMTDTDYANHCAPINALGAVRQARSSSFQLTICRAIPTAGLGRVSNSSPAEVTRCAPRTVKGVQPPAITHGAVTLTQARRTYATGTDTGGRIRLTQRQPIRPGRYTLKITQRKRSSHHGRRRARTSLTTTTSITIS